MKKRFLLLSLVICLSVPTIYAQDTKKESSEPVKKEKKKSKFGSFVKKVGEQTTGINMTDETFSVLPMDVKRALEIEVLGCYGDKVSETIRLVLLVKAKSVKADFRIGSAGGDKAYDKKGNTFERDTYAQVSKDCPAGVPVKYELKFKAIPSSLNALELISLGWWLKAGNIKGNSNSDTPNLEFRNIPIQWNVEEVE